MASFGDRYAAGSHREVWADLRALGPDWARVDLRDDVMAVVDETMRRAAANVATIVVRLTALGYRFGSRFDHNRRRRTIVELGLRDGMASAGRDVSWVDAGDVVETVMGWRGPRPEVGDVIAEAEAVVGRLPAALAALARAVDRVDLSGSFPGWAPAAYHFDDDPEWPAAGTTSAPFNLLGLDLVTEYRPAVDVTDAVDPDHGAGPRLELPIAADHDLAANLPGGYLTVTLPDDCVDPVVHGVLGAEGISLVDYLRLVFDYGGFPGFALAARVAPEIDILRAGLSPL